LAVDGTMIETGNLATTELKTDADGSFEVILSTERKGTNWVRMTEQSNVVLVRQTFLDRKSEEPAKLTIECLNGPAQPAPLTADVLDRRLMSVARFVNGTARTFADWVKLFKQQPNELPSRDQAMFQKVGGDPSIHYVHGYWQLAPDEALVIDTEVPRCTFWNIQLDNYWMESMDYRYLPAHVNAHTARRNADGTVRIVVAHADPGVPNFLGTAGHREGSMLLRWVDADRYPVPVCRVVKSASLQAKGSNGPAAAGGAHDRKDRSDRRLVHAGRRAAAPARFAVRRLRHVFLPADEGLLPQPGLRGHGVRSGAAEPHRTHLVLHQRVLSAARAVCRSGSVRHRSRSRPLSSRRKK
jgi:hypothetical protein